MESASNTRSIMKSETPAVSAHRADTVEAYQVAIERIIRHMQQHLDEPLDLERLGQVGCISKFHLVRAAARRDR